MSPTPQTIGQSADAPLESRTEPGGSTTTESTGSTTSVADIPSPAPRLDPTRYGDWERNGRCIDF